MFYLVTTNPNRIPTDHQIVMVDGTVPGWVAKHDDLHWDHHRPNGADIQIIEMPFPIKTLVEDFANGQPLCIVTTQVDADACCAAAWMQLSRDLLSSETIARLRAIAWDCDHLIVPPELSQWAEFAVKAVATLKITGRAIAHELQFPQDRQRWSEEQWENYTSEAFKRGTEWLIAAAQGQRPYPGESGEADNYWREIEADAKRLIAEKRIQLIDTADRAVAVFNFKGISHSVDPRASLTALASCHSLTSLRPETLTIREHRLGGTQYTLGCIPLHSDTKHLDYTAGTFARLTQAERVINPNADAWGGRRTVGGSGWNTPSQLAPEAVIALLDRPWNCIDP